VLGKQYTIFCDKSIFLFIISVFGNSFPPEWIKGGNGAPHGIGRNDELSDLDKVHIKKLYGPSRNLPRETGTTTTTTSRGTGGSTSTRPTRPTT